MTIKERALAAVKTAYAKYGLKAEELDKIAINIAGGLTDETTDDVLNAAVKAAEFYAEMMQSVGNRKQGEIEKKYEGLTRRQRLRRHPHLRQLQRLHQRLRPHRHLHPLQHQPRHLPLRRLLRNRLRR